MVNATSIKPMANLDFNVMPAAGINIMKSWRYRTTKSLCKSLSVTKDFWLEMRHNSNINYLANKTNSINQTMRSTMAILAGLLYYQESVVDTSTSEETTPGKHILKLDDISLISSN
ncbi:hypothetical protein RhiirA5_507913 [Rhizophagus irregularis]|nr:hypothetical protein RhiirA5_507913 [Rhizophagus irregularis]